MITWDSFSANEYFKGNKSVLLMLQAYLIRICIYFIINFSQKDGVVPDHLQPVDIHPWM